MRKWVVALEVDVTAHITGPDDWDADGVEYLAREQVALASSGDSAIVFALNDVEVIGVVELKGEKHDGS